MAAFDLLPHPDTPVAVAVAVEVELDPEFLWVTFTLSGALSDIVIPAMADPARRDGLWRKTCFELFVATAGDAAYREFNWSPSTEWAAYRFDGYRRDMRPLDRDEPVIAAGTEPDLYWLTAGVELTALPPAPWRFGLSAVIAGTDGTRSYWALAHAPGPPDFHNPDCFVATLPAPGHA